MDGADVVWQPSPADAQASALAAFMRTLGIGRADPEGYRELLRFADAEPERFWDAMIRHAGLRFATPYERVMDGSRGIEWTRWCVGGTTNAALNCLDRHDATHDEKEAVVWEGEDGTVRRWTYRELKAETSRVAAGLRALGVRPGQVVGLMMPMVPEAAAAMLGIVKMGAIVLPLFSGFGAGAIADRLEDAGAVAVLVADGTWRRGRRVDIKSALDEAAPRVTTLEHVIVLRNTSHVAAWHPARDRHWHDVFGDQAADAPTEILDAEAPMMLIYTSGTTGKPKGAVHSHCGFIAKLALDLGLCADYRADDRMLWMSDMGWLAGPILIYATTLVGATMVLAEGAPDFPVEDRFWRLIDSHRVSYLGIAPTIIRSFMQSGGAKVDEHDLSSLRVSLSTGEAWNHDAWTWMFEKVCRRRVPIINYSGGTEVAGGIVTGTLLHPMKPCAFAGPVPGMGADVVDEQGTSVGASGVGELVLRRASIGMTRGLWRAPERYLESYWRRLPGAWWQGDRARIDDDGAWFILGRSDDTLKIAGKRVGPSEVETLASATGLVAEVAAIDIPDAVKGQAVALVAVPMAGGTPDAATRQALCDAVVAGLGAAFRPAMVVFVEELPKTRNMKIMRRVVRAAFLGEEPGDLSSLVNPESVARLAARKPGS